VCGAHRLLKLARVLRHEGAGDVADRLRAAEGVVNAICCPGRTRPRSSSSPTGQPGEPVDRLPVVAYTSRNRPGVFTSPRLVGRGLAGVLELVDHDQVVGAVHASGFEVAGGSDQHVSKSTLASAASRLSHSAWICIRLEKEPGPVAVEVCQ